jgi:hypothetical protein
MRRGGYVITVVSKVGAEDCYEISELHCVIGSSPDSDIPIQDPGVEGRHLEFVYDGTALIGRLLAGNAADNKPWRAAPGDGIRIGSTLVRVDRTRG